MARGVPLQIRFRVTIFRFPKFFHNKQVVITGHQVIGVTVFRQGEEVIILRIPAYLDGGVDLDKFGKPFQLGNKYFVIHLVDLLNKVGFANGAIQFTK